MKDIIKGIITMFVSCAVAIYVQDYITPLSKIWPSVILFVGMFCCALYFRSAIRYFNKRFNRWLKKMGAR